MLWVLLGVAALALASAIRPGWVRIFLPPQSRIPGAAVRTPPTWEVRAVSLGVLGMIAVAATRLLWPVDAQRDLVGFGTVLVVGIALSIWILASIVDHHDRDGRALAAARQQIVDGTADADTARRHRRGAATDYRFEYSSLFVTVMAVIISGLAFATMMASAP